ncbi:MAG: hypothetical protein IJP52_01270 [Paludibacteraceae bacterium]|nr:hypothetical protein [Paludibacteraceae bacterium]
MMQRHWMIIFLLLLCSYTAAQTYKVGDIMVKDNIPCLVVYVDSTGQHGLIMTPPALREQDFDGWKKRTLSLLEDQKVFAQRYAKRQAHKRKSRFRGSQEQIDSICDLTRRVVTAMEKMPRLPYHPEIRERQMQEREEAIVSRCGGQGIANREQISQYCAENGILMALYFPEIYWASLLGNDWFIPGTEETTLILGSLYGGVGRQYRIPYKYRRRKHRYEHVYQPLLRRYEQVSLGRYLDYRHNTSYMRLYPLRTMTSTAVGCPWSEVNRKQVESFDQDYAAPFYSVDWIKPGNYFKYTPSARYQVTYENGYPTIPVAICAVAWF